MCYTFTPPAAGGPIHTSVTTNTSTEGNKATRLQAFFSSIIILRDHHSIIIYLVFP